MIFIIVPVFMEEVFQVRETILDLLKHNYNVVIVNDGWDKKLKQELSNLPIHYLRHSINLGQGAALQTGVDYALLQGAEIIVHFDADGQHNAEDIERLVRPLILGEFDIMLGSRFLEKESTKKVPIVRKVLLQIARFVNFIFTGLLLSDAHNGLRALNRKAAIKINLTENRFAHATEILSEINTNKLRFREMNVSVNYSYYSRKKGQKSSNMFGILLDLILSKIFH